MFFEGCSPHLGCSIKLRGASEYELARVKEIIMLMVCVAYHSQLEISFLMDEFAMPPSLAQSASFPCLLEGASTEKQERQDEEKETNGDSDESAGQSEEEGLYMEALSKDAEIECLSPPKPRSSYSGNTEMVVSSSSPFSSPPALPLAVSPPFLLEEDQEMTLSDTLVPPSEGETREEGSLVKEDGEEVQELCTGDDDDDGPDTPTPRRFRDPLQDDTGMFVTEQVASFDDRLKSISSVFKQELKDIILCISPFITFKEPFLLTPAGMHCPSRDYFPEQVLKLCAQRQQDTEKGLFCFVLTVVFHLMSSVCPTGLLVSAAQQRPEGNG